MESQLPEEVLQYVMAHSTAFDLARLARVAHTTRRAAGKATVQRLASAPWVRTHAQKPPAAASTRALRSLELLEARVGPGPRRGWRDEWIGLQLAKVRRSIAGQPYERAYLARMDEMREELSEHWREGGAYAPDRSVSYVRASVDWKLARGWDRDAAEGYTLLMTNFKSVLGDAFGANAEEFAASAHLLHGAFQGRAAVEGVAPRAYNDLDGTYGLRRHDAAWAALGPDAVVGATFVTNAPLEASSCDRCLTDAGFCAPVINVGESEDVVYEPQDSDIVCFESAEPDGGGHHSLVRTAETDFENQYDLPPLATIRLVGIDEPGTWTAFGATPNRRLYRVTVSFL
mmetsp:Transcript_16607/g.57266  ORF Transcript_16607/g.57266 Transcript_16607/m.57266 type:complete len:344 (+) Transcript_16607:152-1183(+)